MAKTELSVVVRINAAYETVEPNVSLDQAQALIKKIRAQVDGLNKYDGVTAVNMDYTTSRSDA